MTSMSDTSLIQTALIWCPSEIQQYLASYNSSIIFKLITWNNKHFLIFFLKLFCLRNESWIHWRASSNTNISTLKIRCEQSSVFLRAHNHYSFLYFQPRLQFTLHTFLSHHTNACFIALPCMLMQIPLTSQRNYSAKFITLISLSGTVAWSAKRNVASLILSRY